MEWDFSLPAATPVVVGGGDQVCAFGTDPKSWTVPCGAPGVYEGAGMWWCMDHGPLASGFRRLPSIGEAMVFCIGCGDPMPLSAALTHGCDLPPAGRL